MSEEGSKWAALIAAIKYVCVCRGGERGGGGGVCVWV